MCDILVIEGKGGGYYYIIQYGCLCHDKECKERLGNLIIYKFSGEDGEKWDEKKERTREGKTNERRNRSG